MLAVLKANRLKIITAGVLIVIVLTGFFFFLSTKVSRTPYDLTDGNWQNGISRTEVGFFVENNRANAKTFKVGMPIVFASGERQIVSVIVTDPYLNVYLAGNKLNPSTDGFPHTFEIGKVVQASADTPFNLTDSNWQNGISRSEVGFFVENNSFNMESFKIGMKIQFASGIREITNIIASETYLNIYLNGEKMNPLTDGNPNKFQIIKNK